MKPSKEEGLQENQLVALSIVRNSSIPVSTEDVLLQTQNYKASTIRTALSCLTRRGLIQRLKKEGQVYYTPENLEREKDLASINKDQTSASHLTEVNIREVGAKHFLEIIFCVEGLEKPKYLINLDLVGLISCPENFDCEFVLVDNAGTEKMKQIASDCKRWGVPRSDFCHIKGTSKFKVNRNILAKSPALEILFS